MFFSSWITSSIGLGQGTFLTPQELEEDFEIFRGALKEMHPGLYWYSSKKEMDKIFEGIQSSLNREMTDLDFFRLLSKAISKIRCGHTWIAPAEITSSRIFDKGLFLPIEIRLIDNKVYYFKNYSDQDLTIEPGEQILKVNQYSIDSLIELSDNVHPGDGWTITGKHKILERNFNWFYAIQLDQPESYLITYLDKNKVTRETKVKAIRSDQFKSKNNAEEHHNIETRIIDNDKALLRIKQFDNWKDGGKKKKFLKVLQKTFNKIDSARIKNLIIDLRGNGGGTERFGLALCSYFTDEPFYGYKKIRFKNTKFQYRKYSKTSGFEYLIYRALLNHKKVNDTTYLLRNDKNLKLVKPSEPHFSGNVYILTDGGTYSTAADFTAIMHSKRLATFIGEETGGGYRGNTSNYEFEFVLPNSKIRFNVPLAQYLTDVSYTNVNYGRGTIPDHEVQLTIENLINGIDTVLEYNLDLIEND